MRKEKCRNLYLKWKVLLGTTNRLLNISVGWGTEIRLHTHLSMSCFYWKTVTGVGELGTSVASATAHTRQHPQHSHRLYSASNQHIHQYIMYCIIKSSGSHFGAVTMWSKHSVFWGMYRPKKKVGLVACGRLRIMIRCVSSTLKHEKVQDQVLLKQNVWDAKWQWNNRQNGHQCKIKLIPAFWFRVSGSIAEWGQRCVQTTELVATQVSEHTASSQVYIEWFQRSVFGESQPFP